MKTLKQIIQENFKFKINRNTKGYEYQPKSWDELRQIIEKRFERQGPGTEQNPVDFNDIDISEMTTFCNNDYKGIFAIMQYEYIDISYWDVSKVKNMTYMFHQCTNLKSVGDLSKWDVSRAENMFSMFCECKNLKSIDISSWDTSRVENMAFMFACCEKLESIGDLSNWNVSSVRAMNYMFYVCENLKSVGDLNGWNLLNIKRNFMNNMFEDSGITNTPKWYKE